MIPYHTSFVLCTKNRLSHVQILFRQFFSRIGEGEEIVVVDGGSTDGSADYLSRLFQEGVIHQFISEPDRNQAEGWNKGLQMARGLILKKIIDDDVYCLDAIRKCARFLMEQPKADVLISNDMSCSLADAGTINRHSRRTYFDRWRKKEMPSFTFGDVHMLIRKSALDTIGLYDPYYTMLDWEFSLRITHLQTPMVFFTGFNALSVSHAESVSSRINRNQLKAQAKRAMQKYRYAGDRQEISLWSEIKIALGYLLLPGKKPLTSALPDARNLETIYEHLYRYLDESNREQPGEFSCSWT